MRDSTPQYWSPCRMVLHVAIAHCLVSWSSAFVPSRFNPVSQQKFRTQADGRAIFVAKMSNEILKATTTAKRKKRQNGPTSSLKKSGKSRQRRKRVNVSSGAAYQRQEMLNHEILTREEEVGLGRKILKARELREAMLELIETRKCQVDSEVIDNGGEMGELVLGDLIDIPQSFDRDDLREMSVMNGLNPAHEEDESVLPRIDVEFMSPTFLKNNLKDGTQSVSGVTDELDHSLLTEKDIIGGLNVAGGRAELRQSLLDGAAARERLIRSNIRLVVNIAKRWAKQTANHSTDQDRLAALYGGSWNRPSLDEAIQEGIVGLAKAADRFDPNRGLRFSTYSTYWITNYVRLCFQTAVTGCLRVPAKLHVIKSAYNSILKRCYSTKEEIPPEEDIAKEIGIPVARLRTALRFTQSLVSIDAPVSTSRSGLKGSQAGGDEMGGMNLLLSDTIQCAETKPEDKVELSFLRQCLENAMATELSPYERDVLRLRLGLDDGVTRTVREVVEFCGGSVSMADVRRAEQRAFKKLRSPYAVHTYKLLSYLDFAGVDIKENASIR